MLYILMEIKAVTGIEENIVKSRYFSVPEAIIKPLSRRGDGAPAFPGALSFT